MLFRKYIIVLVVVFTVGTFDCLGNSKEIKENLKMLIGENEDLTIQAESVKTHTGATLGFCIKIINSNQKNDVVFVMYNELPFLFNIRLINESGLDISSILPKISKKKRKYPQKYKKEIIVPHESYILFIPIPHQTRINPRKYSNEDNLHTTPSGQYLAEIKISLLYYIQNEKSSKKKYPDYKYLKATSSHIPITIDNKLLNENIEKIYNESLKNKP